MSSNAGTFDFGKVSALTIFDVAEYEEKLVSQLHLAQHFCIDLSGVEELDSAGLQWLMHLIWLVKHNQKTCELKQPSALVQETSALLGVKLTGSGVVNE